MALFVLREWVGTDHFHSLTCRSRNKRFAYGCVGAALWVIRQSLGSEETIVVGVRTACIDCGALAVVRCIPLSQRHASHRYMAQSALLKPYES